MKIENVEIKFLGHSGFFLENGMKIAIDPYNVSSNVEKADIILITHSHYDHCSIKDIQRLSKQGTIVVATADSQSKITRVDGVELHPIELGEEIEVNNVKIEAVPAYNLKKNFHPKNEKWIGYVIKMGKVVVYHAGDTDLMPEMKNLTGYGKQGNKFIALLPVSGTYVMDAEEAAEAAEILKPHLAIPMHYGSVIGTHDDARRFVQLCKDKNVHAEVLEKV